MDNSNGVTYLFKNRKFYFIALMIGAILGGGLTFFIPKKYLSTAIVYPYNSHTVSSIVSNPQFGYEVETEQLLQLLESKSMRDRTIEKFKLYDYYEEDTSDLAWKSKVALNYIADVEFFRSKYLSVVINVQTKDPQLSADIANFQVEEVNKYREQIFEENRYAKFNKIKEKYDKSASRLDQIKDSIYEIKKGSGQLLYNFIENLNNENYDASEFVNQPELEVLVDQYLYEKRKYDALRTEHDQLKQALDEELPSIYSIDRAEPSYKKASPSFLINTAIGALALLFLAATMKLVLDKWKQLKKNNTK